MPKKLLDYDVLTFDCYGTLIDWESGLMAALLPWLERQGRKRDRTEILETFARFEAELELERPTALYPQILAAVHKRLAVEWGLESTDEEAASFGSSVPSWPPFEDSTAALRYLEQHYRLVILSNIDRQSFKASEKRLGVTFDTVFTAEEIGSYKPDRRNFAHMLRVLGKRGITPNRILHTAQSLFHDHVPAQKLGLATAWIDRRRGQQGWGATPPPPKGIQPDYHFSSLGEMVEAHRARL